jgi:hypothetical protein
VKPAVRIRLDLLASWQQALVDAQHAGLAEAPHHVHGQVDPVGLNVIGGRAGTQLDDGPLADLVAG